MQLFDFKLVHMLAKNHQGPDCLSWHKPIPGEDNDDGDPEEWVNDILSLGLWLNVWEEWCSHPDRTAKVSLFRPPRVWVPQTTRWLSCHWQIDRARFTKSCLWQQTLAMQHTRDSMLHYIPSSIASGGHCSLTILGDTSGHVTSARFARQPRSKFPQLWPCQPHSFIRLTSAWCSRPMHHATNISYKPTAPSPYGLSGIPSIQKWNVPLV